MNPTPVPAAPLPTAAPLRDVSQGRALALILGLSVAAFLFLVWLVYLKHAAGATSPVIRALPACDALFNTLSTGLLIAGYRAVRRREYTRHLRFMSGAFLSSACFLICYVVYHNAHGDTRFLGQGAIRPVYFAILISHITLSAVALPLILTSFFLSLSGKFPAHRRLSRYTFPAWLYVSVTGVLVYLFLRLTRS